MFKVMWMLKRKDGITPQQFKERYERHAILGKKYCGQHMLEYRRNYGTETWGGGVPTAKGGGFGPITWGYDCIAEWILPNEEALNEINRVFADPVIGKIFHDDEEDFLDRNATVLFKCDMVDTGTR